MLIIFDKVARADIKTLPLEFKFDSIIRQNTCNQSAHASPEREYTKKRKGVHTKM
jgi:hypothetical protein